MNLFDELQMIGRESFDRRFDEWYKKADLENKIKQSAMDGYNGYRLDIVHVEKREELRRLFKNKRFEKELLKKLGEGFVVEYVDKREPYKLFGTDITAYRDINYLRISWRK